MGDHGNEYYLSYGGGRKELSRGIRGVREFEECEWREVVLGRLTMQCSVLSAAVLVAFIRTYIHTALHCTNTCV